MISAHQTTPLLIQFSILAYTPPTPLPAASCPPDMYIHSAVVSLTVPGWHGFRFHIHKQALHTNGGTRCRFRILQIDRCFSALGAQMTMRQMAHIAKSASRTGNSGLSTRIFIMYPIMTCQETEINIHLFLNNNKVLTSNKTVIS